MAVTDSGEVLGIHPAESLALVFDQDGTLVNSFEIPVREAHQLALATLDGKQSLWIADPGRKNLKSNGSYEPTRGEWGGQVVRVSLNGDVEMRIGVPTLRKMSSATHFRRSLTSRAIVFVGVAG